MQKKIIKILIVVLSFFYISVSNANEVYLSLKKDKVYVRYGPGFDSPIKFVYRKINLPIKQIDKKENWRRIIDLKNNSCLLYTSPSPRDATLSRMPSSA